MRVLVVDDEPGVRKLVCSYLALEGFTVHLAEHGVDALGIVRTVPVDSVILDLEMPVIDGSSFFRALRALPCDAPVLVLSGHGAHAAKKELGAEDALDKPFDPRIIAERVRQLVAG